MRGRPAIVLQSLFSEHTLQSRPAGQLALTASRIVNNTSSAKAQTASLRDEKEVVSILSTRGGEVEWMTTRFAHEKRIVPLLRQ